MHTVGKKTTHGGKTPRTAGGFMQHSFRTMKKHFLLFLAQILVQYSSLFAQSGNLDPFFHNDGILSITMGQNSNSTDKAYAVALQTDGKIVVAGNTWTGSAKNFAIARCNADGMLDTTFNNDGIVTTSVGGWSVIRSIAIQPDGKIIAVGYSGSNQNDGFLLARYNSVGSLDGSFGTNGKVITIISGVEEAPRSVALQPDGKIVVGGYTGNNQFQNFALARYTTNGQLDASFGIAGIQITPFTNEPDGITSIALQTDGKIVAAGYSYLNGIPSFSLARYNADGSLDVTFDSDGKITTTLNDQGSEAWSLAIQNDGKIVVGGRFGAYLKSDFGLVRYNTDGSIDSSFGINGSTVIDIHSSDVIRSIALWPDGRIVAAGSSSYDTSIVFAIAQYNSNGIIDSAFGNNGIITTQIANGTGDLKGLCLQTDGKIVVAGDAFYSSSNWDFVLARYLTDFNMGIAEFTSENSSLLIYPNPIVSEAELSFTLTKNENLSLRLLNIQGHLVQTFYSNQFRQAGVYKDKIMLSSSLSAGMYILDLSNGKGKMALRIVKE
ncbi:MAG: T9SS type A sorting domain-containing protein [Saprospiraceae bacterium]